MSAVAEGNEHSLLIPKEEHDRHPSLGGEPSTANNSSDNNSALDLRQKILNTLCILVTELCERLTFFGASANLVLFSKNILKLDSPWPSTITLLFGGTCSLTPLLGGWLADAYLGRFNTIYGSSLLYVVGILLLSVVSITDDMLKTVFDKTARLVYFALALVLIAFSTGGIKANVSPFGADQVEQDGPRAVQTYFNWFYWFINTGALVAYTVVVGVQQSDVFSGYAITAVSMFLAIVAFLACRNKYVSNPPRGSQLTETAKIICEAIRNRKWNPGGWLDGAKSTGGKFTDAQVEDVKAVLRVLPVFIMFCFYFTVYSQMDTAYLIQGTFMKLKFESFTMPAASLSVFDIVIILVLAPLMDRVIYPLLDRIGINFTPLRRIGVGFVLSAAAMLVAGLVEIKRRDIWEKGDICIQTVFKESHNASCFSIFWQAPQYLLIGLSEVLANITGLEFAYSQAPKYLRGVIMALYLATNGIGSYLANLLVAIVTSVGNAEDWYPEKDPNKGHFEYFFFLLGGLMMLNFLVFLYVASSYKYKETSQRNEDTVKEQDVHELTVSVSSVCS